MAGPSRCCDLWYESALRSGWSRSRTSRSLLSAVGARPRSGGRGCPVPTRRGHISAETSLRSGRQAQLLRVDGDVGDVLNVLPRLQGVGRNVDLNYLEPVHPTTASGLRTTRTSHRSPGSSTHPANTAHSCRHRFSVQRGRLCTTPSRTVTSTRTTVTGCSFDRSSSAPKRTRCSSAVTPHASTLLAQRAVVADDVLRL